MTRKHLIQLLIGSSACWLGCVEQVDLSLAAQELPVIIEGVITDQPGPDTIKITKAYPVDGLYHSRVGVDGALVKIKDDIGTVEALTGISGGYYVAYALDGTVGRTYTLSGVLSDGTVFESTLEKMAPAGSIDSILYELVSGVPKTNGSRQDEFNIYVNSTFNPSSSRRIRWKFNGTYRVVSDPSQIQTFDPNCLDANCPPITLPCATGCQCCICYAYDYEESPIISDTRIASNVINRTFIRSIPINSLVFHDRYRVEIVQMEVSQPVYDFYSAIKRQIESGSNLFQPPFLEVPGNVKVVSGSTPILGIFSAASQTRKHIYIYRSDVPYLLANDLIAGDCRKVAEHSTTTIPPFWN